MVSIQDIQDYANKIAERFLPEKIILFGSYASGQPTEDSDVDLLVIMPFEGKSHEASTKIRLAVRPPFALDLVVKSPKDVESHLTDGDMFFRGIFLVGKTLYEEEHRVVA
ncbi:MAG: nucleotidyltransferase domain-containing protein [Candidatus Kapaibacterium sp.]